MAAPSSIATRWARASIRSFETRVSTTCLATARQPTQADGKFHQIRVRVKRPKVDVRARKGYWASTAEDVSRAANPTLVTPQPILDALAAVGHPQPGRTAGAHVGGSRLGAPTGRAA